MVVLLCAGHGVAAPDESGALAVLEAGVASVAGDLATLKANPALPPRAVRRLERAYRELAGARGALDRLGAGQIGQALGRLGDAAQELERTSREVPAAEAVAARLAALVRDFVGPKIEQVATLLPGDPRVAILGLFHAQGIAQMAAERYGRAIQWFHAAWRLLISVDREGPEIALVSPERYVQDGAVSIHYRYDDALSEVRAGSVTIAVDGVDRTTEASRTARELRLQIPAGAPLAEGDHALRLAARDRRNNASERTDAVFVDLTDPTVAVLEPAAGTAYLNTGRPTIRFEAADPGVAGGIDPATGVSLREDGADVSAELTASGGVFAYRRAEGNPLSDGSHEYVASVADRSGRRATAAVTFTVDTIPPVVTVLSPAGGSTVTKPPEVDIALADANGVALVSVRLNGVEIVGRFALSGGRARAALEAGDLVGGANRLEVTARDVAGNFTGESVTFTFSAGPGEEEREIVLEIVSGNGQRGYFGRCAGPKPQAVRLVDRRHDAAPVPDVSVVFVGAGSFVDAPGLSTVTDANGIAGRHYLLPRVAGLDIVRAIAVVGGRIYEAQFWLTVDATPLTVQLMGSGSMVPALRNAGELAIAVNRGVGPLEALVAYTVYKGQGQAREEIALPAEERIWVGPELGARTHPDGVGIAVVPREAGYWTMTFRLPEFPEAGEAALTFEVVDSVLRPPYPEDPPGSGVTNVIRAGANPGLPGSGRIGTYGRRLEFAVDTAPVAAARSAVFLARTGQPLTSFHVGVVNPGNGTGVLLADSPAGPGGDVVGFRGVSLGGVVRFWAEPKLGVNQPNFVNVEIVGVGAAGAVLHLHLEAAALFGPELTVVRDDGAGTFVPSEIPYPSALTVDETDVDVDLQFRVEVRAPLGIADGQGVARLLARDRCSAVIGEDGRLPGPVREVALTVAAAESSGRFATWRSSAFRALIEPRNPGLVRVEKARGGIPTGGGGATPIIDGEEIVEVDVLPDSVVRTGPELRVEYFLDGRLVAALNERSAPIIDAPANPMGEAIGNGRISLCAGEALQLAIAVPPPRFHQFAATSLRTERPHSAGDRFAHPDTGEMETWFSGAPAGAGRATIPASALPGKLAVTLTPEPVSGESFRNFTIANSDFAYSSETYRPDVLGPKDAKLGTATQRLARVGPVKKTVGVLFHIVSREAWPVEKVQEMWRNADAIFKQACISVRRDNSFLAAYDEGLDPDSNSTDSGDNNIAQYRNRLQRDDEYVNIFLVEQHTSTIRGVSKSIPGETFDSLDDNRLTHRAWIIIATRSRDRGLIMAHETMHALVNPVLVGDLYGTQAADRPDTDLQNDVYKDGYLRSQCLMWKLGQTLSAIPDEDCVHARQHPRLR